VDWNGEASQVLRFEQLYTLFSAEKKVNVLDFGCGYGAFYGFLDQQKGKSINYTGYDISENMIQAAHQKWGTHIPFSSKLPQETHDFVIASGIFNVKQQSHQTAWEQYIKDTLDSMHRLSRKGFAFNILTSYSDPPYQKDYLYYADPAYWFGYCKQQFSPYVALLHDYPLYEFCILVRK